MGAAHLNRRVILFAQSDAPARSIPIGEGPQHPIEEPRRQKAVIVAVGMGELAQVVAWPKEFIVFADDDPRTIVIEAEMAFDRHRNFDCSCRTSWGGVRDRQTGNERGAIGLRSTASTMTLGLSFYPSSSPARCSCCQR